VLVVDDDEIIQTVAPEALGKAGFEVYGAETGLAALDRLDAIRPDIIVLDVTMPGLDGYSTCERIRAKSYGKSIPILMVTGLEDGEAIDRAYRAGATDFSIKPIRWSLLCHRLRYMLRNSAMVNKLNKSESSLANSQKIARLGSWEAGTELSNLGWSGELFRLFGVSPDSHDASLEGLLRRIHEEDRDGIASSIRRIAEGGGTAVIDHRIVRPDGSERSVWHQIEAITDSEGHSYLQGTIQDVTERQRDAAKIRQLAYFDCLTTLPNRELFKERLAQGLEMTKRHPELMAAVLFLDLDDFKRVNDTLGHSVGDMLLKAVAERLKGSVRKSDLPSRSVWDSCPETIARLGGDEFTLLLWNIRGPEEVGIVAKRILSTLSNSYLLAGNEVFITPSIGISIYPRDGDDIETLLKNADTAMYYAKRSGKNLFKFHDDAVAEATRARLRMDNLLRSALERDEFFLHYQPQMDLVSGEIGSVEALLRWQSPELGLVSPMEFVPLAEENGLIIQIGEWVLRTACRQIKLWRGTSMPISRVAVNISMLQFVRPGFPEDVERVLRDTGLEPEALELELTESFLVKDVAGAIRTLNKLKRIGVTLSIDDFGTGYSSLSQLKRCPIDRLKIDRSFIRDITSDPDDAAITTAVINMASSMNLRVVAEGVEDQAQLSLLKRRKCDEIQGYYLSRPLAPEDLEAFFRLARSSRVDSHCLTSRRYVVLLVDDDATLRLTTVKALEKNGYHLLTAADAEQGLAVLAEHEVHVVVSDFNMPGLTGTEFLERVRRLYPRTIRLILTGVGDKDTVVEAVNGAAIHKYLEKPVSAKTLRTVLRESCMMYGDLDGESGSEALAS